MAARPLRRAICAGAKKGAAVVPAVVALRTIAALWFCFAIIPLQAQFRCLLRARQSGSMCAVLLRRPFASRSFLLCRPLTLRAFGLHLAAPRKTLRFIARVNFKTKFQKVRANFKSGILTNRVKIAKLHIFRPMEARWRNKIYEF